MKLYIEKVCPWHDILGQSSDCRSYFRIFRRRWGVCRDYLNIFASPVDPCHFYCHWENKWSVVKYAETKFRTREEAEAFIQKIGEHPELFLFGAA